MNTQEASIQTNFPAGPETPATVQDTEANPAMSQQNLIATVIRLVRGVGILALIASAVHFLFSEALHEAPFEQFLGFLGLTGLLVAGGWTCATRLDDRAGGRAILAVAAGFVPALMTHLGGFIYRLGSAAGGMAPLGPWQTVLLAAASLPVLFTACHIGISSLSRHHGKQLSIAFFVTNLLLLIPVREDLVVALIALFAFALLLKMESTLRARIPFVGADSAVLRLCLLVPIGILIGRNWIHFGAEHGSLIVAFGSVACTLGIAAPSQCPYPRLRACLRIVGILAALVSWLVLADMAFPIDHFRELVVWALLPFPCIIATFNAFLNKPVPWVSGLMATLACIAALGTLGEVCSGSDYRLIDGIAITASGLLLTASGLRRPGAGLITPGALITLFGAILSVVLYIIDVPTIHWGVIAAIGLAATFGASLAQKQVRSNAG